MFQVPAPNFTQTPNVLFDEWLPHLGMAELKVLMVIMRKTFGWHKIRDRISLSQLQKVTGLERTHVVKGVKSLVEKGLITKLVVGLKGFQDTYYELVVAEDSNNFTQCRNNTPPSVVKTLTKETLTKEIKKDYVAPGASRLAALLLDAVKKTKPDIKPPNLDKWAKEINKMVDLDNRSPLKITKVIEWLPTNAFWSKNILSADKLRIQFDRLELEMKNCKNEITTKEQRLEWKDQIQKEYRKAQLEAKLFITEEYVEFSVRGNTPERVYVKDEGFIEACNNYLRKL